MTQTNAASGEKTIDKVNEKVMIAASDPKELDRFLSKEQNHILKLTGKVLQKKITVSDDEYSIALLAVSEAVKNYDRTRGDFWSYAAFVIKSREIDYYRSGASKIENEMTVSPELFNGDGADEEQDRALQHSINDKTAVYVDTSIRDEIEDLKEKLGEFDISFFDLAECSPKSQKSKNACSQVLKAIFTPPPLIDELIRSKSLPIKKILERQKVSRKLIDRHRRYLMSAAIILEGDYPGISEYIPYAKEINAV
ncbi:MAG: hypothetical protein K6G42_04010 [Lachnospiraceae bacterium]|nr:hypothetical protein [Lachnospiraceae bacterium]